MDQDNGEVTWQARWDKSRRKKRLPASHEVLEALDRRRIAVGGHGWLFRHPVRHGETVDTAAVIRCLERAEKLAGLEHEEQGGCHAIRRKFASERIHSADPYS